MSAEHLRLHLRSVDVFCWLVWMILLSEMYWSHLLATLQIFGVNKPGISLKLVFLLTESYKRVPKCFTVKIIDYFGFFYGKRLRLWLRRDTLISLVASCKLCHWHHLFATSQLQSHTLGVKEPSWLKYRIVLSLSAIAIYSVFLLKVQELLEVDSLPILTIGRAISTS